MDENITVVYQLDSGYKKELEATDMEQAIDIAKGLYEQVFECEYAAVLVNGEVAREWVW